MEKIAQVDIGQEFGSPWGQGLGLGDLVSVVLNSGIAIGGILVIFLFIFGGLGVIRGAGSGDAKAAEQGKQAVTYAVIGFLIVFAAFWIIRIIEVITGTSFLTNPLGGAGPLSRQGSFRN